MESSVIIQDGLDICLNDVSSLFIRTYKYLIILKGAMNHFIASFFIFKEEKRDNSDMYM